MSQPNPADEGRSEPTGHHTQIVQGRPFPIGFLTAANEVHGEKGTQGAEGPFRDKKRLTLMGGDMTKLRRMALECSKQAILDSERASQPATQAGRQAGRKQGSQRSTNHQVGSTVRCAPTNEPNLNAQKRSKKAIRIR